MNKPLSLLLGAAFALASQFAVVTSAQASASGIVISQVYGGGGNTGAVYRNDFIELFNAGSAPVSLTGWSVQYASATGSSWQVTNLTNVALAPGQYYLVQQGAGTGGTQNLPTPDATGTILMGGAAGKVALVSSTAALTSATPSGGALVDLVGYGTTVNAGGHEGAGPTPAPSNTNSVLRAANGCTDTDNNATDFASGTAAPRNGATPLAPCGTVGNAPILPSCPAISVAAGAGGSGTVTATDADGIVNGVTAGALPSGVVLGTFTPAAGIGGNASQQIVVQPSAPGGTVSLGLTWSNADGQTAACTVSITVGGLTPIYSIQGSGSTSPLVGQSVMTSGVVTKVLNNGFYLQDPVGDGNPLTSDGILVFTSTAPTVSAGQRVQLTGTVTEFNVGASPDSAAHPVTELTGISGLTVLGTGTVTPITLSLPVANRDDLERYEGMLVTLSGPLTASQNYFQGRYGQVTLSALGRLENPTNRLRPGPGALAMNDENIRRSIILDDGTSLQNPNPTPYIGEGNTLRAGDTVASVTGVIDFGLATASNTDMASYKINPVVAPVFTRANPRTLVPEAVGGNIRVASFNVLNFFTTFLNGNTASGQTGQGCSLGGQVSASNCRGANDLAEFTRQRTKIVEAIAALNADAVGLMEIQNNGNIAAQNLVDALNARVGAGTYAVVPEPAQGTGTDAIRVAMIYQPARVTLSGASRSDANAINNRPPLAQTFTVPGGETFTVIVNHLKSKSCGDASGLEADQGDLQGCWNPTRVAQARQLRTFVQQLFPKVRSPNVILLGDFNAYAQEDPIADLTASNYVDVIGRFSSFGYSYVFNGAAGRLDHALVSSALVPKVTRALHWAINADEPVIIDYNLEFRQPACATCGPDYYSPTPYRASDHDPVLIGLQIGTGAAASARAPALETRRAR